MNIAHNVFWIFCESQRKEKNIWIHVTPFNIILQIYYDSVHVVFLVRDNPHKPAFSSIRLLMSPQFLTCEVERIHTIWFMYATPYENNDLKERYFGELLRLVCDYSHSKQEGFSLRLVYNLMIKQENGCIFHVYLGQIHAIASNETICASYWNKMNKKIQVAGCFANCSQEKMKKRYWFQYTCNI